VANSPLTIVSLSGSDLGTALRNVPDRPGVAAILGHEGHHLLVGRAARLRPWAAFHLGLPSRRAGKRPPTDLRPIATAVGYLTTTSSLHQRIAFERLMTGVPLSQRRDLKVPFYLHLDTSERFPRVTLQSRRDLADLVGPFRDRRQAGEAVRSLHKRFPLRPCDYVFEPDPELALGLGCIYAQLRTCAAPCLGRYGEGDYRALAHEASTFLSKPGVRGPDAASWLPSWVGPRSSRGLLVEEGIEGIELYPVREGAVLDQERLIAKEEDLLVALGRLRWSTTEPTRDDTAWVMSWLQSRKRKSGAFLLVEDPVNLQAICDHVREALA